MWIDGFKWSPDSRRICIISKEDSPRIFIWDVDTAALVKTLSAQNDARDPCGLTYSMSGDSMILVFSDHTMELWDSVSLRCKRKLRGHNRFIWDVLFAPDDRLLASVSQRELRLWNAANGAGRYFIKSHGYEEIRGCTWAPDSKSIALHLSSGSVHLWEVVSMTLKRIINGRARSFEPIHFSPNGDKLVIFTEDHALSCWNVASETAVCERTFENGSCNRTWFSEGKGRNVRYGDKLIDFSSGSLELKSPEGIQKLSFHRDWIFCGDQKITWLPPDYRISSFEAYGSTLALGHHPTGLTFLELDLESEIFQSE